VSFGRKFLSALFNRLRAKRKKKKKERKGNHSDRAAQFSSMSVTLVFLLFSVFFGTHNAPVNPHYLLLFQVYLQFRTKRKDNVKDTPAVSYFPQSVASFKHAILRNFCLPCSEYAASAAVDSSVASTEHEVIAEHQVAIVAAIVR